MVGIVIVSHSALIAEGVVELARQMGGEAAVAAAGGIDDPDAPIGTDPFRIKEAIESVWSPDGVLVLMDLGSAVMNAEIALDLLAPTVDASRVLLCDAPLVEGAVAAVATAALGSSLSTVAAEARAGLSPKAEHLAPVADPVEAPTGGVSPAAPAIRVTIPNRLGLHLRPAGRLVETVGRFDVAVEVANLTTGAGPASARSLSRISVLGARQGHVIEVRAEGPDAEAVLQAVRDLADDRFGDRDDPSPPLAQPSSRPAPAPTEGVISGVAVAPGVALGPARYLERPVLELPERTPDDPDHEWGRLRAALEATRQDVERQRSAALRSAGAEEAGIFTAHRLVLDDEALVAPARRAVMEGHGAETAWAVAVEEVAGGFRALDDPYQAERAGDVEAVGRQVLARLLGVDARPRMTAPGVLVADDLDPGETTDLEREVVAAIVTVRGGPTSHSAILARALGIPAVMAVGPVEIPEGVLLVVDGAAGTVTVDPDPDMVADAQARIESGAALLRVARREAASPAVTLDGVAVEVAANIGSVSEATAAVEAGADAVGLLRTEFLFLNRRGPPTEDEQETAYRAIAAALDGRPLVVRTFDIGGDKPVPFLERPPEENPFLGVRGLRLGLARPDLLITQLRAVLRVAADHPLRVMFPMVATIDDWERARALVAQASADTGGMPIDLELGVMVEVPSVALVAERFAPVVDFFSIGTNDLTQYTLAAERGNPELAGLADALHPAVLTLIDRTCRAAERHGRWVGVCGELASDPVAIPVLVGLGVTELSMSPASIPGAKQVVRRYQASDGGPRAAAALEMASAAEVRFS